MILAQNQENMNNLSPILDKISRALAFPFLEIDHLEGLKEALEDIVNVIERTIKVEKTLQ